MVDYDIVEEPFNGIGCVLCCFILITTECDKDGGTKYILVVQKRPYEFMYYGGAGLGSCVDFLGNTVSCVLAS